MNFQEFEELIKRGAGKITLSEDVILEEANEGIEIDIDGLVIDGNNHTIDANSLGRMLIISSDNVTLKNIRFINGKARGGGAIVNYGFNLKIINCTFKNNWTNGGVVMRCLGGGAIGSYSDMSLCDCLFENNSCCGDNGGAIYLEQFHPDDPIPEVVIINSYFKNNYSDGANNDFGSDGGAIYNKNANLYLSDCKFYGNGLTGWSNFDYNESIFNGGFLSLDNCCFHAENEGYCIFNQGKLFVKEVNFNHEELVLNKGSLEYCKK